MTQRFTNKVIYDFSLNPITFDLVNFLATARLTLAAESKEPCFHLTFLADKWRNWSRREQHYSLDDRLWRLHNLAIPICSVTPAVTGLTLDYTSAERERSITSPADFSSNEDRHLVTSLLDAFKRTEFDPHLFVSPAVALEMASKIYSGSSPIALISLRASAFEKDRDTPLELFGDIAEVMKTRGYKVFVIPDQESLLGHQKAKISATFIPEASINIALRLALHELANVSICTQSGPTSLINLAVAKPNMVNLVPVLENSKVSNKAYFEAAGYSFGTPHPLPWTPSNQIWLWEEKGPSAAVVCDAAESVSRGI